MAKPITEEEVLRRFKEVHGNKYDYSLVNYIDAKTKVIIICSTHGEFETSPSKHYGRGHGCPQCAGRSGEKLNVESFIKRSKEVHGDKYDYSLILDKPKSKGKVSIVCPVHGEFKQRVDGHLAGHGCKDCVDGTTQERKEVFIIEANKIHNGKYSYDKVVYENSEADVIITCPIHGDFNQTPYSHAVKGSQCPQCASRGRGFKPEGEAILYYLKIQEGNETFYKIGITGKAISERYSAKELSKITVLFTTDYTIGREAYKEEQRILKKYELDLYTGKDILMSGNTEIFTKDVLNKETL